MGIINICTPSIVYLSFGLAGMFIGINYIKRSEVMFNLFTILLATFLINMLCINGLNAIAWYTVILFIFCPLVLSAITLIPIVSQMLSKIPSKNPKPAYKKYKI